MKTLVSTVNMKEKKVKVVLVLTLFSVVIFCIAQANENLFSSLTLLFNDIF